MDWLTGYTVWFHKKWCQILKFNPIHHISLGYRDTISVCDLNDGVLMNKYAHGKDFSGDYFASSLLLRA